jgi:hypothetical protein
LYFMVTPALPSAFSPSASFALSVPTSRDSTVSFAQQLAGALEGFFGSGGNGGNLSINIQATVGQGSGGRQFLVTVNPQPDPGSGNTGGVPSLLTPSAQSAPAPPRPAPANEVEAYWAQQPPEVQALRSVPDEAERTALAQRLANEGFKIDVPIMVWKWDPLTTMTIRQNSGYTWVPSGNQQPLPTCPNCDIPGLPAYDPDHPPAGSITVSTDFAKGLESTAPWKVS